MKHRDVVANFLFKSNSGQVLVALFRRSTHPNVRSYQGKLAPISGSIDVSDTSPLEAAVREIREETQLVAHRDVFLKFAGKPFSFTDDEAQRSWTVHPFGWTMKVDDGKIKLDWEHSGWEWVSPERVLSIALVDDCVPNIDQSLKRVYYGPLGMFPGDPPLISTGHTAGEIFQSTMETIRTDKENGARILATEALKGLGQLLKAMTSDNEPGTVENLWWDSFRVGAYHLVYSARPSMVSNLEDYSASETTETLLIRISEMKQNAAIKSAILQPLKTLQSLDTDSPPQLSALSKRISASISQRFETSVKISRAFQSYIRSLLPASSTTRNLNIITLSSSSTIRSSLLHLLTEETDLKLHLSILESRPLCEGASLAEALLQSIRDTDAKSRLHITLAPDSHVTSLVQQKLSADLTKPAIVLLGADRITPSGHVSNKMGSLALAVLAKTLAPQSKVVVLSEVDKIATPSNLAVYKDCKQDSTMELREHVAEANDIEEVTKVWPLVAKGQELDKVLLLHSLQGEVNINNFYFEMVNSQWIDIYITEDGPQQREDILSKSLEMGQLEEEIFGSLYNERP